jgi:diguanylate cyclase (GGDEF)-like protein
MGCCSGCSTPSVRRRLPNSVNLARALVRPPEDQVFASGRDLPETLAPSEEHSRTVLRLRTALRQIVALVGHMSRLQQEVMRLTQENARVRELAFHDALTGLPNRTLLQDRFRQAVALATRQGRRIALLFLDLDHFKRVNDTFGHVVGDRLLQQVAARLTSCLRASDTACRYGGDEFVVLLPELESRQSAIAAADKILAQLSLPFLVSGAAIEMTASIGIAFHPEDGTECSELIRVSDRAMYRNKGPARGDSPPAMRALSDTAHRARESAARGGVSSLPSGPPDQLEAAPRTACKPSSSI